MNLGPSPNAYGVKSVIKQRVKKSKPEQIKVTLRGSTDNLSHSLNADIEKLHIHDKECDLVHDISKGNNVEKESFSKGEGFHIIGDVKFKKKTKVRFIFLLQAFYIFNIGQLQELNSYNI